MEHIQDEIKKFESHAVRVLKLPLGTKGWTREHEYEDERTQVAWLGWLGKAKSCEALQNTLTLYCKNNPQEHTRLVVEEDGYTCLDCPERWFITRDRRSEVRYAPKHFLDDELSQRNNAS